MMTTFPSASTSSDSPQHRVANISRFVQIQVINLVSSPDSSPAALDALALLLYGDDGVQQACSSVLERARGVVGSIVGRDHDHHDLEELAKRKAGIWWHKQLVEGIESLNLPADMRTFFRG